MEFNKVITSVRSAAVFIVAAGGALLVSFFPVRLIYIHFSRGVAIENTALALIFYFFIGGVIIYLFCMLTRAC